jgi:hypothetical protein
MEPVSSELKAVGIYASLILAAAQNQICVGLARLVKLCLAGD